MNIDNYRNSSEQLLIEESKSLLRRIRLKLVLGLVVILVFILILYAAAFVYKSLNGEHPKQYRFVCVVPYGSSQQKLIKMHPELVQILVEEYPHDFDPVFVEMLGKEELMEQRDPNVPDINSINVFEQRFDIYPQEHPIVLVTVPSYQKSSMAIWIHDWGSGLTGILDPLKELCFAKPMDLSSVTSPVPLMEIIQRLRYGQFDDIDFRVDTHIMKMRSEDFGYDLGFVLYRACMHKPIYHLEHVQPTPNLTQLANLRSGRLMTYIGFSGRKVVKIIILNDYQLSVFK